MAMKEFFKKMISLPPEDDYEDEYYEEEEGSLFDTEDDRDISSNSKAQSAPAPKKPEFGFFSKNSSNSKTVNLNSQIQVVLVKPMRFEEAASIAEHLCAHKTVVLNLEAANRENSRRLIDFLMGTAYAVHGNIKQVANSTYIITPDNVDVLGELLGNDTSDDGVFLG